MSKHIERAVFRILLAQQKEHFPELSDKCYVVDLIDEIMLDPLIGLVDLDLRRYQRISGVVWSDLIEKHARNS